MTTEDSLAFKELNRKRTQLVAQLESARIARAVGSQRQLLEVMTDFWENHFNIYVKKGAPEPYYLVDYDRTIREHALGKFRDLLGAVAHSPAMLFYLDNAEKPSEPGCPSAGAYTDPSRENVPAWERADDAASPKQKRGDRTQRELRTRTA